MSTSESNPLDGVADYIRKIRERGDKFRVLIIGRANAGKTTILQRTCNTTENPVIYGKDGKRIDPSVLESSAARGLHDIENEMVFKSRPSFRFHDSRGFESGGIEELMRVKSFIENRIKQTKLEYQLHVIWYCIPVDDSRLFTAAEQQFFAECGNGDVPIIIVFTKFDALDNKAFKALRDEKVARSEALRMAPKRALEDFETVHQGTLSEKFQSTKDHVYLRDMNKETADVSLLMTRTADALNNKVLQQLFVSTQRNNLELCIRYALEKTVMSKIAEYRDWQGKHFQRESGHVFRMVMREVLAWFPHYTYYAGPSIQPPAELNKDEIIQRRRDRVKDRVYYEDIDDQDLTNLLPRFTSLSRSSEPVYQLLQLGIMTAHLGEASFLLWNKGHNNVLFTAMDLYEKGSVQDTMAQSVEEAAAEYQSQDGFDLSQKILQIAMSNRLSPELLKTVDTARNEGNA